GSETSNYLMYYGAKKEKIFNYPFTSLSRHEILKHPANTGRKARIKSKLNIKEEKIILSIGRFIQGKGFDVLLEASAHFPQNYGVYIVGGTPTEEYLEMKKELNLTNVHFLEFQPADKLREYYIA